MKPRIFQLVSHSYSTMLKNNTVKGRGNWNFFTKMNRYRKSFEGFYRIAVTKTIRGLTFISIALAYILENLEFRRGLGVKDLVAFPNFSQGVGGQRLFASRKNWHYSLIY